uniref:Uncharacterized protein n=1 Tax=Lepeophtheirus salmonis TaxID=72036 RepID=A0A0K2T0L3_LEPSM
MTDRSTKMNNLNNTLLTLWIQLKVNYGWKSECGNQILTIVQ